MRDAVIDRPKDIVALGNQDANIGVPSIIAPFIDITLYEKFKKENKKICVWNLDSIHDSPVEIEKLFGLIELPICERHHTWHCAIVTLVVSGNLGVYEVLEWSREVCMTKLISLGLMPIKS